MPDCILLVRITGVEPARLTAPTSKVGVSAFSPYPLIQEQNAC